MLYEWSFLNLQFRFRQCPKETTKVPVRPLFGKPRVLVYFPPLLCCFWQQTPFDEGPFRAGQSCFSCFLVSCSPSSPPPSPVPLPAFLPTGTKSRNKPNLEETREACPHLWNPLKGCCWKRIQKQGEGFRVPFSGSIGRSLWVRSGETWVPIYVQEPFMSCHQQEDFASRLSWLWIQRFYEKTPNCPNWVCGFAQSGFFSLRNSSSSSPLLPSVSPLLPTATPAVGPGRREQTGLPPCQWTIHQISHTKE